MKFPVTYITHGGGPWPFMDRTGMGPDEAFQEMENWMRELSNTLPEQPKAVLVLSAHWEEPVVSVMSTSRPQLFFDYYGFPEHTYELTYPAQGDPELAFRIQTLLNMEGIPARLDDGRDYDHGTFIPFMLIYPEAQLPIVQLSLRSDLDATFHIELGRALAPLREEGVWVVGSGMSYHNLRRFGSAATLPSRAFDEWLTGAVLSENVRRNQLLIHWNEAPEARVCHPRAEHLIPLMVVAGAAGKDAGKRIFHTELMGAAVSAYEFS